MENFYSVRLCIVEGRGSYKRAPKYCPVLDTEKSGIECVIGTDSPEDLIATQWADVDVLVTNELRHRARPYERRVVAIVNRRILPDSSSNLHAILRNRTLCHPGVGLDDLRPLSETLSARKYPSLCAACRFPSKCAANDPYWGDLGALNCLGEGAGDVTWAELDDVNTYFGLTQRLPMYSYPSTERFAVLCRDGTWQPLDNSTELCTWLHRPWPVVVAKR
ncbi:hypothetical protein O3G_MSEX012168 [Manduca sexta]|uniref:Transferrin-like domain-containing protein n=1 Tax=Manduca sexta TaxID=7130 RepID=A0A922CW94_MANSE|nr:hypothetical protein O3G_MSEX012168 [Manduca sexta]